MNREEFEKQAQEFFLELQEKMRAQSFKLEPHWSIDHICYRVASISRYNDLKVVFSGFGRCLGEIEVNGRAIATYKLNTPIFLGQRIVDLIELPAPKNNSKYEEGFEHLEVVCDKTFDEMRSEFKCLDFKKGGENKDFNAELAVNFGQHSIKFHHLSLESVTTLEANTRVFNAIMKLSILSALKNHRPLIAGTFPLAMSHENSDVDILVCAEDLDAFHSDLKQNYGGEEDFKIYKSVEDGLEYLVVKFVFEDVAFEVFAQPIESVRQRAYKHFQIEERLLKIGGKGFRQRLQQIRKRGVKTEPAFAMALELEGDPYLELLKWHEWTDISILEKLRKCGFAHEIIMEPCDS